MKMKTTTLFTTALLLLTLSLQSQALQVNKNSLGLSWGLGKIMRQDFIFSDIMHAEVSPINFILSYTNSGKLEHVAYVKFGRYTPSVSDPFTYYWETPAESEQSGTHEFNMLDLNYSLGKRIVSTGALSMTAGVRSRNRLHQSYYCYGMNWLWHFAYYFTFGADAWTRISYEINPSNRIEMNMALPMFSFTARSPYLAQDDQYFHNTYSHKALPTLWEHMKHGEWQSWGKSMSLDLDLNYYFSLTENLEIGASYWLSVNYNSSPVDFRSLEHVYYLNARLHF